LSTVEKGTGFELRVAGLFRQRGYRVTHNVRMTGRSGAAHQIDVLAQFEAPLHTSTVIIEAKDHSSNIDKDTIMKLIHIQQDLSADRAILATTSGFTLGAQQIAQPYPNVELWDGGKMKPMLKHVRPIMDGGKSAPAGSGKAAEARDTSGLPSSLHRPKAVDSVKAVEVRIAMKGVQKYAKKAAAKRSGGKVFGRGKTKESVKAVTKFLYPYYDVYMEAKVSRMEKTGWFSRERVVSTVSNRIGVDGNTGSLINVISNGISYAYSYLCGLSGDQISMLHHVAETREFERRNITLMDWTDQRINSAVNGLAGKGMLVQTRQRPATYRTAVSYPHDPSILKNLTESLPVTEQIPEGKKLEPLFHPAHVGAMLDGLWSEVDIKTIDMVYYPHYMIVYERQNGSTRHEILDGMSGIRHKYLENIVSEDIEYCGQS